MQTNFEFHENITTEPIPDETELQLVTDRLPDPAGNAVEYQVEHLAEEDSPETENEVAATTATEAPRARLRIAKRTGKLLVRTGTAGGWNVKGRHYRGGGSGGSTTLYLKEMAKRQHKDTCDCHLCLD